MFPPNPMYETNAIQLHFYCGSFDIYHSGLAGSHLFFVPVYIVKISTVRLLILDFFPGPTTLLNALHLLNFGIFSMAYRYFQVLWVFCNITF